MTAAGLTLESPKIGQTITFLRTAEDTGGRELAIEPVTGRVEVEQRTAEAGVVGSADVDPDGTSVNGDRELLAGQMGSVDMRRARICLKRTESGAEPK